MDHPSGNFQSGGAQTVSVSVGDAEQPSREFSVPLRPQQQALVQDPSVSVDTEMEGAPHQQNVPIDNSGLLPVSMPAYHQESLGPLPPMSLQQLHPVHTLHTRQQLPPSVESSRPVTNQPGPLPNRASDLRPIQPATVARLPPAGTRLAPIQPMAHNMGTSSVSSVPLEAYNVELSDSLSSLGTDSDDDDLRLSGSRTLGLPQNHRMSLGRPTLPPISSESGNTSSSAAGYSGPTSSRGYAGVEPPRYEQIASTSTAHRPGNTAVVQTTSQPDHTDHSQGGSYGQSSTGDVIGEYFRDPHQFASTAEIHTAAMEGVKPSVLKKMVFQYGVEYRDAGGRTPLMYAVLGNQPKMCEVLVQMGSNVDAKDSAGLTPLLWASYRARPHAMKVLLRHNADVQCTDPQGRTAYHWSMKTADTQCIKLLCKYAKNGVQNKTDNEGLSPLHWAVMCDQDSHIHIFLTSTQVDATCQDPNGRTALNYAILNFSPSAIKAVLDHAEEVVNLRDGKGRTALHYACAEGSTDCIRTLLTYKSCNLHCTDYQGTTPLHWGAAANQPEVLKLLLRLAWLRTNVPSTAPCVWSVVHMHSTQVYGYMLKMVRLRTYVCMCV
jgi:ankyrin repeat protein